MAKKLIPEELDALIQEYLTDGVLTDKERAVILKKAEGMGLDHDEIDLYLDARIQKIDQASDTAMRRMKSEACPYCGTPIPQLTGKCPSCGQFITPQASEELQEILDNLEKALVDLKAGADLQRSKAIVERYTRKAKIYFENNPQIQRLLEDIENEKVYALKKAARKSYIQYALNFLRNISFLLFISIVGMIFCILMASSYSGNKHQRAIHRQLNEEFILKDSVEIVEWSLLFDEFDHQKGDVNLQSIKEYYPEAYREYLVKFQNAKEDDANDYQKSRKWRLCSLIMLIISVIMTIVVIIVKVSRKK